MNNSKIAIDNVYLSLEEPTQLDSEREAELIKLIEAINVVRSSAEWGTLKTLIFDSRVSHLNTRLKNQSEQATLDTAEIYRLQGRLFEARKYDLDKLLDSYRLELSNIRRLTQPTER